MPYPELKGTKKFQVKLFGVSLPVGVTITEEGISLGIAGTKKKVFINWYMLAGHCETPQDVPSFLYGKPLSLLQNQAQACIANGKRSSGGNE